VVEASDFEIGPLVPGGADPAVAASLALLEKALLEGKLPDSLFASDAARVASVFLPAGLETMPAHISVRYAAPLTQAGGTVAAAVRIIAAGGPALHQAMEASALGLVILSPAEDGRLLVAHLELDLPSLGEKTARTKAWDPYALHQAP
jgi:predicted thioesterase